MIHTTIQDNSRTGVGWESTNTSRTQGDRGEQNGKVNILGNLAVVPHEASVDVFVVNKNRFAADQVLETSNNLTTVVEDGVGNGGGVNSEEPAVDEGVSGGEVSWGVSLVTGLVEHALLIDDLQDFVTVTGVIPNVVIVDSNVRGVPGVGVPNRKDHRGSDERTEESVKDAVEGIDEGVCGNGKLIPVKSGDGIEAKATNTACNRGQVDIIWGDPGHPVKVGHGLDDVVGEPEVDEHRAEAVHKPPHPRDGPAVSDLVSLHVEGTLWR